MRLENKVALISGGARGMGAVEAALQSTETATHPRTAAPQRPGTIPIPLAEFGKSVDDPDFDQWFEAFAERNSDLAQYEISNTGHLLIREPTGYPGAVYETELAADLVVWARQHGGVAFGATSRFALPDGSYFGPDAAWISLERRHLLDEPVRRAFPVVVPDFIAEIKSPSNSNAELLNKIDLFLEHGSRLAWFIDAETRTVIKFRPGQEPQVFNNPEYIDGDADVLPGFRFAVRERIFDLFADTEQPEELNAAGEQGSPD